MLAINLIAPRVIILAICLLCLLLIIQGLYCQPACHHVHQAIILIQLMLAVNFVGLVFLHAKLAKEQNQAV